MKQLELQSLNIFLRENLFRKTVSNAAGPGRIEGAPDSSGCATNSWPDNALYLRADWKI